MVGGNEPFVQSCQVCSHGAEGTYVDYQVLGRHVLDKWPRRTAIHCWNDGGPFTSVPVALPVAHDEGRETLEVTGVFCSVACAKRYALDTKGHDHGLQFMWLARLCTILFGDPTRAAVRPAPPRNTLRAYGGHLDLEAYRSGEFRGRVRLLSRPLVSYPIVAHIAPTQGQLGQVTGLRRPTARQVRKPTPQAVRTGPGLLAAPPAPPPPEVHTAPAESKGDDGPKQKKAPPRRSTRGSLDAYMKGPTG